MLDVFILFIFLCLTVCGLTSGFLYSDLLKEVREWWLTKFKNYKIKSYAECQLCLSVPTTLAIQWLFIPFYGIGFYILFAFSTACVSWALGTFVTMCGWIRCSQKEKYYYLLSKQEAKKYVE